MTAADKAPPALAGEVWRGLDALGEPIAVVYDESEERYRPLWWDAADTDDTGAWSAAADSRYAGAILAAWALAERARAERAEERFSLAVLLLYSGASGADIIAAMGVTP